MTLNENVSYIVVDLDGTLVSTDTLIESLFKLIKSQPSLIFQIPFWLFKGKAGFKIEVAKHISLDPAQLPYNNELLHYLRRERAKGRKLILATAAHKSIALSISEHLGFFERVLSTNEESLNLAGKAKSQAIPADCRPFFYAGNASVDLDVWRESAGAIVVGPNSLRKQAEKIVPVVKWIEPEQSRWTAWNKALRIHQWAKNLLIFLPLILAHRLDEAALWRNAFLGFIAFSVIASSVYLLNDIVDLDSDRQHPEKRNRPLARGSVSLPQGLVMAGLLFVLGMGIAAWANERLLLALLGYYILTTIYSFKLKKIPILDAFTLAGLYSWRILSGGVVTETRLTFWLMAFSMFFFLSLAFAKRSTELKLMLSLNKKKAGGRGYFTDDLAMVNALGVGSGMASVVIFAMYVNQPVIVQLYQSPRYLLAIAIVLLYWISRVWLLTDRGQMNSDPILFAVKDKSSYFLLFVIALSLLASKLL